MKTYKYIFITTLICANIAHVDSTELAKEQIRCGEYSRYDQITECYTDLYNKSYDQITKENNKIINCLGDADKKKFINEVKTWDKSVEIKCNTANGINTSDFNESANQYACLFTLSLKRLKYLENLYKDKKCTDLPK